MLLVLAKRRELRQAVTPSWKAKVRAQLKKEGRGAFTRLAEGIGSSTGKLGDLLDDGPRSPATSPLVGAINKHYGWPEWSPPSGSADTAELIVRFEQMDDTAQHLMLDAAELLGTPDGLELLGVVIRTAKRRSPG